MKIRLGKDILQEDLEKIAGADFIPWDAMKNATVLVTGATGLIGYTLVSGLLYANQEKHLNLSVLALVRNKEKAEQRFEGAKGKEALQFVVGSVEDLPTIDMPIDYIIHGASQTASKAFIHQPVETITTAVKGTANLLELAKKGVKGFTYLSSMEVYGHPEKGHKVTEREIGAFPPYDLRNSYPISKIQCESLVCAYAKEYGVSANIIRLTQTFGPGAHYDDNRIFAYFARCAIEKKDIVLKTKGETERSYLYTADAATAILTVLLKGELAQAYNAADEATYCSIAEMAEMVADAYGIQVAYDLQDEKKLGYPAPLYMDLDTSLLRSMGWRPLLSEARHGG
ncbi:MAG: NAD(P)-dependent oxidoreductase [Selenomonas sp.]|nr:NAD(P)-dependent oxidoreductase [Selenomonas sp.]